MEIIISDYSDTIKFVQNKDIMKFESVNNYDSPEEILSNTISFVKKLLLVYKIEV